MSFRRIGGRPNAPATIGAAKRIRARGVVSMCYPTCYLCKTCATRRLTDAVSGAIRNVYLLIATHAERAFVVNGDVCRVTAKITQPSECTHELPRLRSIQAPPRAAPESGGLRRLNTCGTSGRGEIPVGVHRRAQGVDRWDRLSRQVEEQRRDVEHGDLSS